MSITILEGIATQIRDCKARGPFSFASIGHALSVRTMAGLEPHEAPLSYQGPPEAAVVLTITESGRKRLEGARLNGVLTPTKV